MDQLRLGGSRAFPDVDRVLEPYGWPFPIVRRRRLEPSILDRIVLGRLDPTTWQRPLDVYRDVTRDETVFYTLWGSWGMSIVAGRLQEWARHRPDSPALESRRGSEPPDRIEYRLTSLGERILERGLDDPEEAPPFWIGGVPIHTSPYWVRRVGSRGWRIERLAR